MVAQGRLDLLGAGDQDHSVIAQQIERSPEGVEGEQLGQVGALRLLVVERDLAELAVLHRELGRRRELQPLGVTQRTLGEGGEPANRFDLVAEQLDAGGALLGRREDVQDVAPHRKLAAVLHLVHALVPGLHQELADNAEVHLLALYEGESGRAQRRVGHRLGQRDGTGHHHGRARTIEGIGGERVERRDPQTHEMRRWCEMGFIARAARRVEAHPPRRQIRGELSRQVARRDVVGRDNQCRSALQTVVGVEQRGDRVRADGRRHQRVGSYGPGLRALPRSRRQSAEALVVVGDLE